MNTLEQALRYPYDRHNGPFLYLNGTCTSITPPPGAPLALLMNMLNLTDLFEQCGASIAPPEHWVSLISFGSNRSPTRLAQKFPRHIPIIGLTAQLKGFDVVRSAHFTSYGTLPATLIRSQNTSVEVSLQWLPQPQLERMHSSEAVGKNYLFSHMPAGHLLLEDGSTLSAWTYQSIHGPLYFNGSPLAFQSISAQNRLLPECDQESCLRRVHALWNTNASFEDWILNLAQYKILREEATSRLKTLSS